MFESEKVPYLKDLFALFSCGKHLNRNSEPRLWMAIETAKEEYINIFSALGYTMCVDNRGFAYFDMESNNAQINNTSKKIAFLLLILYDYFNQNNSLNSDFTRFVIDTKVRESLYTKHQGVLNTLALDSIDQLINLAKKYNLLDADASGILRMTPAVWRYIDIFNDIYEQSKANNDTDSVLQPVEEDTDPTPAESFTRDDEEFEDE